jgi:hypothetical protein
MFNSLSDAKLLYNITIGERTAPSSTHHACATHNIVIDDDGKRVGTLLAHERCPTTVLTMWFL